MALPFEKRPMTEAQTERVKAHEREARSAVKAAQVRFIALCVVIIALTVYLWVQYSADVHAATGWAYFVLMIASVIVVRQIGRAFYKPMRRKTKNVIARHTGDLVSGDALVYAVKVKGARLSGVRGGLSYYKLELDGDSAILVRGGEVEKRASGGGFPTQSLEFTIAPRTQLILAIASSGDRVEATSSDQVWDDVKRAVGPALMQPEFVML